MSVPTPSSSSSPEQQPRQRERLRQIVPGLTLIIACAVALILTTGPKGPELTALLQRELLGLSVQAWVSDGLLTVFFFTVGLELRRELTTGQLSTLSRALLPMVAALGGMLVPALVYLGVNGVVSASGGVGLWQGWAVPIATDIAFAVSLLALVAPGVSPSGRAFLLALAVADDLFAIVVIAVVFSTGIGIWWLVVAVGAVGLFSALLAFRGRLGPIAGFVAALLAAAAAILAWWSVLESGVHPTIAGVALGLAVPAAAAPGIQRVVDPLSTWVVVPVFAFVSSAVPLSWEVARQAIGDPAAIGAFFGLIVGKPVGIVATVWLMAFLVSRFHLRASSRSKETSKPAQSAGLYWGDLWTVAQLAGVGFTVSLLVTQLTFHGADAASQAHVDHVTLAVLAASGVSALLAGLINVFVRSSRARRASR